MNLIKRAATASLLALTFSVAGAAAQNDAPPKTVEQIKSTLQARYPKLQVEQVHKGPVPGLYEVMTNAEIIYTNETAELVFAGRVVNTKTQEDVTAKRWNELNAVDFASLPFDLAIKTVRGDGSRKIAVFSDPLCPYCRELEQQMEGITNVTIYTFLYPLETGHPGAGKKANSLWCSSDRAAAWSSWMLQQTEPKEATCEGSPVSALAALGDKLHINSTPTVFLANGQRSSGAVPRADLEKLLTARR
ncbi:MAG: DsbC family protein [Gammaproteobacteria bacterium]